MSQPTAPAAENRTGVAIGFCTYKRLAGLQNLLDHIARLDKIQELRPVIIVADNDGNDPAVERIIADFRSQSGLDIHCLVERTPGISAARNAVFAKADGLNLRFLAMLDDDEWPSPVWLNELLAVQARSGAAVVGGPVRPVFPPDGQGLQRYARFWSVDRGEIDGKTFVFCTCNFLIDLAAITSEPRPLFEAEFGLSGGGDTVFFRRLFFGGYKMDWADKAQLQEEVPPKRANIGWIRQRRYRVGNHMARWETADDGKAKAFLKTLGLTARLLVYPLLRREPEALLMGWLLEADKVRGRYALHFGEVFVEYERNKADCKNVR